MQHETQQDHLSVAEQLIGEQNFPAAVIAGGIACLLAAAAYGIVVARWPIAAGFAAAGVGIVVGLSMLFLGRGFATKFGVAAALLTMAGCLLGNLFRVIMERAIARTESPIDVIRDQSLGALVERSFALLSFLDLVYWMVAVFAAVFLARRALSRSERLAIGLSEEKHR